MMPKQVMHDTESNNALHDGLGGGRKGRSAPDMILHKEVAWTKSRLCRTNAADMDIDLSSCFDFMVTRLTNLACRRRGMPKKIATLYRKIQNATKYKIVTAQGVSTRYNNSTSENPVHGSGQGAGDSSTRWVLVSNGITLGFSEKGKLCQISNPCKTIQITTGATSFIDDTTIILDACIGKPFREFAQELDNNLSLWENLVNSRGGKLIIGKSSVTLFWWKFDADGDPKLSTSEEANINITSSHTKSTLRQRQLDEAPRFLGAYPDPSGNMSQQEKSMLSKSKKFNDILPTVPLTKSGHSSHTQPSTSQQ